MASAFSLSGRRSFGESRTPRILGLVSLIGFGLSLFLGSALALDDDDKKKKEKEEDKPKAVSYTPEQLKKIRDFFCDAANPTVEEDGTLSLVYDFERLDESLAQDWTPIERLKGKVTWTKDYQGSAEGAGGIILSDDGYWLHKAYWDSTVTMNIEVVPVVGGTSRSFLAPVYCCRKGKHTIGANGGSELVKLSGLKKAGALGRPTPLTYAQRVNFGYTLSSAKLDGLRGGTVCQSTDSKAFLKRIEPGIAGIAWYGNISVFLTKVTMRGKLDPEWVKKEIFREK